MSAENKWNQLSQWISAFRKIYIKTFLLKNVCQNNNKSKNSQI